MNENDWLFGQTSRRTRRVKFGEEHYKPLRYQQVIRSLNEKKPDHGDLMFVLLAAGLIACCFIEALFGVS